MHTPFGTSIRRLLGTAALCVGLGLGSVSACAFHTYAPDPTLVDILLGAESIVLARPIADRSGGLRVIAPLMGPSGPDKIDVAVDFPTRGRLAANPSDAVILARGYDYGPWEMVAYADPAFQSVLADVVPHLPAWSMGGDEQRFQLFADLLDHPAAEVRTLALKELDRADYSLLRALDLSHAPPLETIRSGEEDLRPIRVLLAGLAGQPGAAEVIETAFHDGADVMLPYLGAFVIAMVELRGTQAVEALAEEYLRDASKSVALREKILEALAIQARAGEADTGAAVQRIVSDVLDAAPELGPAVARQFGFQGDWSQADALSRVVARHEFADIADVFALNQYIALSMQIKNQ